MSDLVLVKYDLGAEMEITPRGRAFAQAQGLEVLEESAYDHDGRPKTSRRERARTGRPAKEKTSVAQAAAKKAQAAASQSANDNTKKES